MPCGAGSSAPTSTSTSPSTPSGSRARCASCSTGRSTSCSAAARPAWPTRTSAIGSRPRSLPRSRARTTNTDLWYAAREPDDPDPSAPLVVMVHGSMDRGAAFARVAGHLRELPTVRYDRRGYGRSVGLGAPDLEGHATDLLAI